MHVLHTKSTINVQLKKSGIILLAIANTFTRDMNVKFYWILTIFYAFTAANQAFNTSDWQNYYINLRIERMEGNLTLRGVLKIYNKIN